jgi:hypothetical protein
MRKPRWKPAPEKCDCGWLFPVIQIHGDLQVGSRNVFVGCPQCKADYWWASDGTQIVFQRIGQ